MILILAILSCGGKDSSDESKRAQFKKGKEKIETTKEDLQRSKKDIRCIRGYIKTQQQIPEKKLDYIEFEKEKCGKVKDHES